MEEEVVDRPNSRAERREPRTNTDTDTNTNTSTNTSLSEPSPRGAGRGQGEGPSAALPYGVNTHCWLLLPSQGNWASCVLMFGLAPGTPMQRPLLRFTIS